MSQMYSDRLRAERRQLGWTQAKVAEVLGISPRTVRRWEQGLSVPYPYYRRQLSVLFGKTVQQLGLFYGVDDEIVRTAELEQSRFERPPVSQQASFLADPISREALSRTNCLLGRGGLITEVKERLFARDHQGLLALYGLPCIGKTTLAATLAADQQVQQHFSDGILWAGLGQHPKVLNQLACWGKLLGIVPSQLGNAKSRLAWSHALITAISSRRMLLIIDNAWKVEDARPFLIGGPQCTCLLTTCFPEVALAFDQKAIIPMLPLEEADGLALLAYFVPQLVDQDSQGARSLLRALDYLPLALILVGNALALSTFTEHPWSFQTALAQLQSIQKHLRLRMPTTRFSLAKAVPLSLYAAIALSDQQLSPEAQTALRTLTIFLSKPQSFTMETALAVSRQPREALEELWEAGLLESWGSGCYSLHQVVADYARICGPVSWAQ